MTVKAGEGATDAAAEVKAYLEQLQVRNRVLSGAEQPGVALPGSVKMAGQPSGMKALSGLSATGSRFFASHGKFQAHGALINETLRAYNKNVAAMNLITYKEVEVPGVIPRTLALMETVIGRVNTEEQPRIERIMDGVSGNLGETQGILGKVNGALGAIGTFIGSHTTLTLIALGIVGFLFLAVLILIPLVLLRILFFGL
jgi:hypothetical protein